MSSKLGLKKRRAPLPEEVYPSLQNIHELTTEYSLNDSAESSAKRESGPRVLPLGEPLTEGTSFDQLLSRTRLSLPTTPTERTTSKSSHKNVDQIKSYSDNETLDFDELNDKVEALYTKSSRYGRKQNNSIGEIRQLRSTSSKSSLLSISSVNSASSTDYAEAQMADQEDIVTLTVHVRKFSDALSKLKNVFSGNGSDSESDEFVDDEVNASEQMQVKAHECLGKVLSHLKEVIHQYPSLNSKDILAAAGILISKVKSHKYEDSISDDFYQCIDHLALVFSSSISDFLMGDQEISPNKATDEGEDGVDEFAEDGDDEELSEGDMLDESLKLPSSKQEHLTDAGPCDEEADLNHVLLRMETGVDFCLQWTKSWSKYVKDIANYVEKRAQLEADYTKQLTKLAQTTRTAISEESYLPFQSTFFTALDQDLDYSQRCQQTLVSISGSKFMSPLMQRRSVHDRARKDMKDEWTKMCKQLNDSVNSVKTSKSIYYKRKQELEKLNTRQGDVKETKDSVFGTNKGKKEEELRLKVEEAKQFYTNAVDVANQTQTGSERTKERIVTQTKQLVNECDRTFRSVTRKYFDMMHDLAVPTPIHFKTLAESCQGYEPGKQFEEFVRFQQSTARFSTCTEFQFEEYTNSSRVPSGPFAQELENTARMLGSPIRAWANSQQQNSDCEGGASPLPSPSHSPQSNKKSTNGRPVSLPPLSTDDDSEGESKCEKGSLKSRTFRQRRRPKTPASLTKVPLSKDAETHTFHKIRSPAKCSECESYVFKNGFECAQCGLSCHKKCLENLCTVCGHSRRRTSPVKHMKTFGVYFPENGGVPVLIKKCVKEINRRGLRVKGIYRVSGVKSKMESLCQEFETNADSVDLTSQPPHLIASVLKLYIRQMPEPLMTRKLYPDLIQLAKESPHLTPLGYEEYENEQDRNEFKRILERLKDIIDKLPKSNYLTLSLLIKHLHKVSNEEEHNQMSCQNLAIVFGPTILRQESLCNETSTSSLSSLVDMPHQTRIVALLIVNPTQLFTEDDEDVEEIKTDAIVASSDSESEKVSLDDTLSEAVVVDTKNTEGLVIPGSYDDKDKLRVEDVSPDNTQSQQLNERETSKTNERIDVKGEATIFDDTKLLSGNLLDHEETKNEIDTNIEVEAVEQNDELGEENTSTTEGDNNQLTPRSRVKAFSVGKRNSMPDVDMLAKRGSALMNVFIEAEHKSEARRSRSQSLNDNDDAKTYSDEEKTITISDISNTSPADNGLSTVDKIAEDDDEDDEEESTSSDVRERTSTIPESWLYKETKDEEKPSTTIQSTAHKRKRSATYDNTARRRNFQSRQPEELKRIPDHLLAYSTRAHQRISVKDKIKQLEEKGRDKSPLIHSNTRGSIKVTNNTEENTTDSGCGTKSTEDLDKNVDMNLKDDNIIINKSNIPSHEPLSRMSPKQPHRDLLVNTSSPQKPNEKFCALKMDINLDSQLTPSSDSSSEDTGCSGGDHTENKGLRINPWSRRVLTPRDSNQAPEFV